jgi:hypothetical protein
MMAGESSLMGIVMSPVMMLDSLALVMVIMTMGAEVAIIMGVITMAVITEAVITEAVIMAVEVVITAVVVMGVVMADIDKPFRC